MAEALWTFLRQKTFPNWIVFIFSFASLYNGVAEIVRSFS